MSINQRLGDIPKQSTTLSFYQIQTELRRGLLGSSWERTEMLEYVENLF